MPPESRKEPVTYAVCVPRIDAVRGKDVLPGPGGGAMARGPEGARRMAAHVQGHGIRAPLASDGWARPAAQARPQPAG
jgi:hypothetical protein